MALSSQMTNPPILLFSGHSRYCSKLLPIKNLSNIPFRQLCVDSAVIRKKCKQWGVQYVPSIIEVSPQAGLRLHEGYDKCVEYINQKAPPPPPPRAPPRVQHQYQIAVPKVIHEDEVAAPPPPSKVVPMDPDQDLLDLTPPIENSTVSSRADLIGSEEKEEISEADPYKLQQNKIREFNRQKEERVKKISKKAREEAKTREEESIVSMAKKMQADRERVSSDARKKDVVNDKDMARSHAIPSSVVRAKPKTMNR